MLSTISLFAKSMTSFIVYVRHRRVNILDTNSLLSTLMENYRHIHTVQCTLCSSMHGKLASSKEMQNKAIVKCSCMHLHLLVEGYLSIKFSSAEQDLGSIATFRQK